jgi:transposase-like protein
MKQEKSKKQVYTREFHLLVLKDYYESGSGIGAIVRKYGLSCNGVLHYWLKKYPLTSKSLSLSQEIIDKVMKKQKLDSIPKTKSEELELEIERLRKALAYSELRNEALKEVLNIGKEEYGIDLLKKAGAKQ